MVHSEIEYGFHEIKAHYPSKNKDETDLFIGRFKSDKQYHLLGHRPSDARAYFSVESESNQDLGKVVLPEGKSKMRELVKGDLITIIDNGINTNAEYLCHNP